MKSTGNYSITIVLLLCIFWILTAFSCEKEKDFKDFPFGKCVKGKVIGSEECGEGSMIQLLDTDYGDNVEYYDKALGEFISFGNIISSPGIFPEGIIYFKTRKYDSETDHVLFLGDNPVPCTWVYGPCAESIVVITDYSLIKCP